MNKQQCLTYIEELETELDLIRQELAKVKDERDELRSRLANDLEEEFKKQLHRVLYNITVNPF
jgi:predicted  nucleic acid-binding Zn-ribbon protein